MLLGKVVGTVTSTVKHSSIHARKILIVDPFFKKDKPTSIKDRSLLALDTVQAGIGDTVLINQEGGSCRQVLDDKEAPINHVVVGIVDSL
ncbi:MAG TPA: EutN/CcmL family microcompartment protein [Bdellovibrionota bacterium]|nr:EutN/CcmL family microcompartment protein [Bdellovibrionota bacterium]